MSEQRDLTMGELAALVAPICEDNAYISVSRFGMETSMSLSAQNSA